MDTLQKYPLFSKFAALLLVAFGIMTLPPVQRHVVYPAMWDSLLSISFSPVVQRVPIHHDRNRAITLELEEGQRDRKAEVEVAVSSGLERIEYLWGPFTGPITIRLSNGFTLFNRYQSAIIRLPRAFAYYDTLFVINEDNPEADVEARRLGSSGGIPMGGGSFEDDPGDAPAASPREEFSRRRMEQEFRRTIIHEMTHLRMFQLMSPDGQPWLPLDVPRWFIEGMAVYTEGGPQRQVASDIFTFHRKFPEVDLANGGQIYFNRTQRVAYGVSFFMFDQLAHEYGRVRILDLFSAMRDGASFDDACMIAFDKPQRQLEEELLSTLFGDETFHTLSRKWVLTTRQRRQLELGCSVLPTEFPPEVPRELIEEQIALSCTNPLSEYETQLDKLVVELEKRRQDEQDTGLSVDINRLRPEYPEEEQSLWQSMRSDLDPALLCTIAPEMAECPPLHPLVNHR